MNPNTAALETAIGWALGNQFDAIRQRLAIYTQNAIDQSASMDNVIDAIDLLIKRGDMQGIAYALNVPIDWNTLTPEQISTLSSIQRLKEFNAGDIDWAGVLNSIFTGIGQLTGAGGGNQPPMLGSGQQQPAPAPEQKADNTIYWIAGGIGLLILILILVIALRPRSK